MEQRTALETKLKKIDEQITILNDLKAKPVAQLQSLSQSPIYQPSPLVSNQTFEDKEPYQRTLPGYANS